MKEWRLAHAPYTHSAKLTHSVTHTTDCAHFNHSPVSKKGSRLAAQFNRAYLLHQQRGKDTSDNAQKDLRSKPRQHEGCDPRVRNAHMHWPSHSLLCV